MTSRPWSESNRSRLRLPERISGAAIGRDPHVKTSRLQRRAQLVRRGELTPTGTILLGFAVVDHEPFRFLPGQFVAVDMDHPELGYRRSPYCLYGASEEDRMFDLLVRVVPDGPVSIFLGDLEIGDVIGFRGPSGHSMVPREPDTHLILIATGVGMGPCRCLLRHLAGSEPDRRATLYWGLREKDDVCLLDELLALERALPNFDWHVSMSCSDSDWPPLKGRVTETVPPLLETLADKHFYLTSNGAMISEMSAALRDVGVPSSRIYEESFFNHKHRPSAEEVEVIAARFVASDLMTPLTHIESAFRGD